MAEAFFNFAKAESIGSKNTFFRRLALTRQIGGARGNYKGAAVYSHPYGQYVSLMPYYRDPAENFYIRPHQALEINGNLIERDEDIAVERLDTYLDEYKNVEGKNNGEYYSAGTLSQPLETYNVDDPKITADTIVQGSSIAGKLLEKNEKYREPIEDKEEYEVSFLSLKGDGYTHENKIFTELYPLDQFSDRENKELYSSPDAGGRLIGENLASVKRFEDYLEENKESLETSGLRGYSVGKNFNLLMFGEPVAATTNSNNNVVYGYSEGGELTWKEGESLRAGGVYSPLRENEGWEIGDWKNIEENGWRKGTQLVQKTNDLFAAGKINSFISRYYVKDAKDGGMLSRGRNLLKKDRKPSGEGYDNPYCRVWTSRKEYSKMTDTIRPFLGVDDDKTAFLGMSKVQGEYGSGFRPMGGASRLERMSVLYPNGRVNMTPYRDDSGRLVEDSVKRCMFSIENLAWRDVLPGTQVAHKVAGGTEYDEVNNLGSTLSAEQRGPNGGRIMWFPPYNIKFSENINTNWNSNDFIGRGEKIYTYINTERGGTLSFSLLIDHPSSLDRWRYSLGNNASDGHEEQVLRYFAGCDTFEGTPDKVIKSKKEMPVRTDNTTPAPDDKVQEIKFFAFFPNNFSGVDYKGKAADAIKYLIDGGGIANGGYEVSNNKQTLTTPITGKYGTWKYNIDAVYKDQKLLAGNYEDTTGFTLNAFTSDPTDILTAFSCSKDYKYGENVFSLKDVYKASVNNNTTPNVLKAILIDGAMVVDEVEFRGHASSHGYAVKNSDLFKNRAATVEEWLKSAFTPLKNKDTKFTIAEGSIIEMEKGMRDVSNKNAKLARSVEVTIKVHKEGSDNAYSEAKNTVEEGNTDVSGANQEQKEEVKEEKKQEMVTVKVNTYVGETYDDEYLYFSHLKETDQLAYDRVVDKVKFFNPAFHSITPEGFNARLTFLQQCTRQGPTVSYSDGEKGEMGAGNLAFGRPPYCVLRIGDFYNTKILIESISIDYDTGGGTQWDLNPEGAGVQPMYANVNMTFKFIGGTDISGPIERLQNAVSFNYYSNASIYDRRADYRTGFIGDAPVNTWQPEMRTTPDEGESVVENNKVEDIG